MWRLTLLLMLFWLPCLVMGIDELDNFFAWRHQLTLLTGFLSLSYMCLAILLAARFSWLETIVHGLDKGYALHKKLGIAATVTLILHWLTVKSAHWLIAADLITKPHRHKGMIEGINWRAIGEQVGDISFKVFLIFSIISLVQAISYSKFKFTHKMGGVLVLAGIFHGFLLLDWNIQSIGMSVTLVIMSIAGVWCSWLSLSGRIGKKNQTTGQVVSIQRFSVTPEKNQAIRFAVQLDAQISYKEGQFAYLNFHDGEPAHPFSILDYDPQSKVAKFTVKDLGDYTNKLVNQLQNDQQVTVEGGYGCFQISLFEHQVWVGAGIGIVPFVSRLYWLKRNAEKQHINVRKIDLFYCVNSEKEAFFRDEIMAMLGYFDFIELHIFDAQKGELLDSQTIRDKVQGQCFDVSFCGPISFGEKLQATLKLPEGQFYKELFKMR